jgi:hypothetical protein
MLGKLRAARAMSTCASGTLGFALALTSLSGLAQVSVSGSGTPSYSQAIAVPPGIGGMQPNLSLSYSGGGVNGPVGLGWSVQGISMITRCPATRYTDAMPRGVRFDQNDKLCLDGQRLIQTNATGVVTPAAVYDGNGKLTSFPQVDDARGLASGVREYRTEKDSFARIRAYGIANGSDANGPAYFKVWTKAGQIYEYGAGPASDDNTKAAIAAQGKSIVMVWAVARISDVVGNYIDFKYEVNNNVVWGSGPTAGSPTPGLEWNIAEIQYTGNISAAQAPTNKVIFRYADRSVDRAEAYQQGSKNVSVRLLQGIDSYVNSANPGTLGPAAVVARKVRSTNLVYDTSGVTQRSRLATITECTGASTPVCLPPVRFNYSAGGTDAFTANSSFTGDPLATTTLMSSTGTLGVIPIDYDGDGRTDLLRWSDTPSLNKLWRSNGNGTFTLVAGFNITANALFTSNGCYASLVLDFNGDGLPDLFRSSNAKNAQGLACSSPAPNYLFLNQGNGTFTLQNITGVTLTRDPSTVLHECGGTCEWNFTGWTYGETYFLLDVNGDGRVDVVKAILPAVAATQPVPPDPCLSTVCTRIYLGDGVGGFTEKTPLSNVANKALFVMVQGTQLGQQRNVIDIDGDGLADIASAGNIHRGSLQGWRSLGNGDFENIGFTGGTAAACDYPVDFNADGRTDCLYVSAAVASNYLRLSDGSTQFKKAAAFNLTTTGFELKGNGIGSQLIDINGDGRTDILRWKDTPADNKIYVSQGDGTFLASPTFNLTVGANLLAHSNGDTSFVLGDFLGNSSVQILRLKGTPTAGAASANQLYVKADPSLPDQLQSVISPAGLKSTVIYGSLANSSSGRYVSDRGTSDAASYPLVDLTVASPVVVTVETDVGVGSHKVQTEFAYKGLKAAVDGRGMLGFRRSVQQSVAPNGDALSTWTDYLLDEPYAGVARRTETRKGPWTNASAQLLSWTTNTYCDRTSATNPDTATDTTPCTTNARVRKPYIRKSVEQGADLDGSALPTVTTISTYDDHGNPTAINVTSEATFAGGNRQYTKSTANTFCAPDSGGCPNSIAGDNWILGRLTRSTVTNTVPNLLASLTASAGDAPNATAISGVLTPAALAFSGCSSTTPTTTPTVATLSCTLSNTGQTTLASIGYSAIAGATVSGPTGACVGGTTCGTVTVTTATTAGTYSGTLTATPSTGSAAAQPVSLVVNTPVALALSGCSSVTPTAAPTAATLSCTVSNTGQAAAASISYTTAAGTTASGPVGACAGGATCGTVTVTTGTGTGTYSGTLTATPNTGASASQPVSLVVNTPATLTFSGCSSVTPTTVPTAASMSCTLSNSGQTAAGSISYGTAAGTSVSGPTGTCAAGATCGTVTVTTPTTGGSYSGTLTATPNSGNAATQPVNLLVNTPVALGFSGCSSVTPTTSPTAATMSCTLSNSGQTGATSISFATAAGTSVSGPTGACGAGAVCGTVTVSSSTGAGTYSGTLSATPNAGNVATQAVNLVVNTPAALAFSGCGSVTPTTTPTAATMSCTVSNTGQTALGSISYSTAAGTSVSGPTGACGAGATCGTVTVTTGTGAATYSGTLTATPNVGSGASQAVSLVVRTPVALAFSGCSSTTPTTSPTAATMTCTLSNSGQTPASSISYATAAGTTAAGPTGACGAGATCGSVTVTTGASAATYSGSLTATPNAGTGATQSVSLVVNAANATLTSTPASLAFGTVSKDSFKLMTLTVNNTSANAALGLGYVVGHTSGNSSIGFYTLPGGGTCPAAGGSLAGSSSCTLVVRYQSGCVQGGRNGNVTISGTNFTSIVPTLTATTSSAGTCN